MTTPLPFAITLEVDRDDMDALMVIVIDDEPVALRTLFLRPEVPGDATEL